MTERPLVGITSYLDEAAWGVWQQPAALLPQLYVDAVDRAGGTPVLLPPQTGGSGRLLGRLDGLVLAGGPDIDPVRYGAAAHPRTGEPHPVRDAWEFGLLHGALERDLPVLGICRGMQLLNVALGGDLVQHLPEEAGHQIAPATYNRQAVVISPGSRTGEILGRTAKVPCYHHQAVGRLGTGLRATAWSADETVEAVELPDRRFALAVQWHPEADPADTRLFEAFVRETAK
ncbi:gamma-glutamyl-gamma-aminobutyrate hydrolase family protein [Kitasatospora atroaurantiaca]|uniref:Anthranilate synthase component 2/putative glutamine amidotransferase n=1 Tax=Kitasatospora atroaurantiaca TaxID=285545 RepID=A0A561EIH3_9ACTN|nr:gamma-glutamyl-gamma-aminobutyrate hydrolase family protein [Kitasatospora atroaurantiaca]TWE15373.1 anthranilate synthase component 2/putative glutamine amidotransferase [Kitasatospora atroaurantiaca]